MTNLYETPESNLEDQAKYETGAETELASRWSRLFASLLDGLIGIVIAVPFMAVSGMWALLMQGEDPSLFIMLASAVYGLIGFILVHYYFLNKRGQTIGKMALGIKIVDLNGNLKSGKSVIIERYLPISIVSAIPVVGSILVFVDILFIFRKDKRCIHDMIAGTKVVKA